LKSTVSVVVLLTGAVPFPQLLPVAQAVDAALLFQLCSVAQLDMGAKQAAASASKTAIRMRSKKKNEGLVFMGNECWAGRKLKVWIQREIKSASVLGARRTSAQEAPRA
jgi:hypothetical protein